MTFLLVVVAAVIVGTVAQVCVGFGFALLVVPVLSVVAGPKVAVVTMTVIGLPLTAANAMRWRRDLRTREALRVTLAALVGMPLGVVLITRVDERTLTALVGLIVLLLTWWLWRGLTLPPGRATELSAGAASGVLATSVGTNGPPLVIAFHAIRMPPEAFRATLAATFFVEGSIALLTFWRAGLVTAEVGRGWIAGLPALVVGTVLGERLFARLDPERFRHVVLTLLGASGILALLAAVGG